MRIDHERFRETMGAKTNKVAPRDEALRVAEAVRGACLRAAQDAYVQAAMSGLCGEGAWECAAGAIQALDLEDVLRDAAVVPPESQQRRRGAEGG